MSRPPPHSIAFPEHHGSKGTHFPAYNELIQQVSMTSNAETQPSNNVQPQSGRRPSQSQVGNNLPPPMMDNRRRSITDNGAILPTSNGVSRPPNKHRPSQLSGPESASLMSSVTMMLPPTFGTSAHLLGASSGTSSTAAPTAAPNGSSKSDAKQTESKLNPNKSPVLADVQEDDDGQSVVSDDFEETPAANSKRNLKTGRANSQSQVKGSVSNNAKDKEKRKRQVQSCSECRRRKIKCDKKFPCGPCVLRNDQSICREVEKHNSSS